MSDDIEMVPQYMYDQVKVAYQRQRERTRKLRQERDELRAEVAKEERSRIMALLREMHRAANGQHNLYLVAAMRIEAMD
jgi:cell division septum initiation protein DivIVA